MNVTNNLVDYAASVLLSALSVESSGGAQAGLRQRLQTHTHTQTEQTHTHTDRADTDRADTNRGRECVKPLCYEVFLFGTSKAEPVRMNKSKWIRF